MLPSFPEQQRWQQWWLKLRTLQATLLELEQWRRHDLQWLELGQGPQWEVQQKCCGRAVALVDVAAAAAAALVAAA